MSKRYELCVTAQKNSQNADIIEQFDTRKAARERATELFVDAFLPHKEIDNLISVTIFDTKEIWRTQYMKIDDIGFYWYDKYGRCK